MLMVYGEDAFVANWVGERIDHMDSGADFGLCAAIGVMGSNERLIGGVVFNNWIPKTRNIEVSFASESPKWLTRNIICALLSYPYDQLKVQRLTAITPKRSASARRFLDSFGFKREGVVRRGFGDDDAIISGLLEKEWRASRWFSPPRRRGLTGGETYADSAHAG